MGLQVPDTTGDFTHFTPTHLGLIFKSLNVSVKESLSSFPNHHRGNWEMCNLHTAVTLDESKNVLVLHRYFICYFIAVLGFL